MMVHDGEVVVAWDRDAVYRVGEADLQPLGSLPGRPVYVVVGPEPQLLASVAVDGEAQDRTFLWDGARWSELDLRGLAAATSAGAGFAGFTNSGVVALACSSD